MKNKENIKKIIISYAYKDKENMTRKLFFVFHIINFIKFKLKYLLN